MPHMWCCALANCGVMVMLNFQQIVYIITLVLKGHSLAFRPTLSVWGLATSLEFSCNWADFLEFVPTLYLICTAWC
jgi:hypothetical protein